VTAPSGKGPGVKPLGAAPRVVGSGWTSVVVSTMGRPAGGAVSQGSRSADQGGSLAGILRSLPTVSGSWGSGHLLHGALFSAVLTDDGRIAVGAVPPSMLYAALAQG
jgi:hypothetical protein